MRRSGRNVATMNATVSSLYGQTARPARPDIGSLLRHWRQQRRLSQLELATRAESPRCGRA